LNKIHPFNNLIIPSILKKLFHLDARLNSQLEDIVNHLLLNKGTWSQFKSLFYYYYLWYKRFWLPLTIIFVVMLCSLFFGIIPNETPNSDFASSYLPFSIPIPMATHEVAERISWSTEYAYHLIAVAILILLSRLRKSQFLKLMIMTVLVSLIFSTLTIRVSKIAFGRLRPIVAERLELADTFQPINFKHKYHSFPSGHTSSSFSTTLSLIAANPATAFPLLAYATYIGYTRIYLKQHYPSDVIAGASIGILSSLPAFSLRRKFRKQIGKKKGIQR
jgi:membrane-associated phospholipid phosphatase